MAEVLSFTFANTDLFDYVHPRHLLLFLQMQRLYEYQRDVGQLQFFQLRGVIVVVIREQDNKDHKHARVTVHLHQKGRLPSEIQQVGRDAHYYLL